LHNVADGKPPHDDQRFSQRWQEQMPYRDIIFVSASSPTVNPIGVTALDAPNAQMPTQTMIEIKTVCVYCGSHTGSNPAYVECGKILGKAMAEQGVALVYGGARIGVMGAMARAVLDNGGRVTGIIPKFLTDLEGTYSDVTELVITDNMHDRKRQMFERADGFVALPGGIGTLEELVEMMTWLQLGQHRKPIVVANIAGFWQPFIDLIAHMGNEGFITDRLPISFEVTDLAEDILPLLRNGVRMRDTG